MIYEIFKKAAVVCPKRPAMVTQNGDERLTYKGLDRHVTYIANQLSKRGIQTGDRVTTLFNDEDFHLIVYLALNLLKAVYIPFENVTPHKKVQFAAKTLGIKNVITDNSALIEEFNLQETSPVRIFNITDFPRISKKKIPISLNHIYDFTKEPLDEYIIFSSGTTGDPKAIAVPPQGLEYWADILKEMPSVKNVLVTRGPAFDARIFEYLMGLANQATLHFLDSQDRRDLEKIISYCAYQARNEKPIDCLLLIASQLKDERAEPYIKRLANAKIRHLLVTGDALTPTLKQLCEKYKISLWNCYGPTESTFGLSMCRVNDLPMLYDEHQNAIAPIGQPKLPVRAEIHNETLHIISPYLGRYVTPADIESGFTKINGERAFDTGDLMTLNGEYYQFEGREEFCKVAGVKIYIAALEKYILDFRDANGEPIQAVVVKKDYFGSIKPVCYLVPTAPLDTTALKHYMDKRFRKEEQPVFFEINAMPIQEHSEKKSVDRKDLISRPINLDELLFREKSAEKDKKNDAISPECSAIKAIWCDILGLKDIAPDVEFTDLGGTSIQFKQIGPRIQAEIDPTWTDDRFLASPKTTIQSIANLLKKELTKDLEFAPVKLLNHHSKDSPNIFFIPDILGDGYFTYLNLAKIFAKYCNCNIYGISHPAMFNEKKLTATKKETIELFIRAIKTIQDHGEIHLLGFSMGTWWVYEIAKELHLNNHALSIGAIYLMDGYPAKYYHMLPNLTYAILLQEFFNKIVSVLSNDYYQENISPSMINFKDFDGDTLNLNDKLSLIEQVFSQLIKLVKKDISKKLIRIAHHSLLLLQTTEEKDDITLPYSVYLYLSDQGSVYHSIKNNLGIDFFSNDAQYCFWNNLFHRINSNVIRWGEHEDIVAASKSYCSPNSFFKYIKEASPNPKNPHANLTRSKSYDNFPSACYSLNQLGELSGEEYQLSVYFITVDILKTLVTKLHELGLEPYISYHGRNLPAPPEEDGSHPNCEYQTIASLFCNFPYSKTAAIQKLQEDATIWPTMPKAKHAPIVDFCPMYIEMKLPMATFDFWFDIRCVDWILTLSFKIYADPMLVISIIQDKFDLIPDNKSKDNAHIIYHVKRPYKAPLNTRFSHEYSYCKYRNFNDDSSGSESEKDSDDEDVVVDKKLSASSRAPVSEKDPDDKLKETNYTLAISRPPPIKAKKLRKIKKLKHYFAETTALSCLQHQTIYLAFELFQNFYVSLAALLAPYSVRCVTPTKLIKDCNQGLFRINSQTRQESSYHDIPNGATL